MLELFPFIRQILKSLLPQPHYIVPAIGAAAATGGLIKGMGGGLASATTGELGLAGSGGGFTGLGVSQGGSASGGGGLKDKLKGVDALRLGLGTIQAIGAWKAERDARKLEPSLVDVTQARAASALRRKQKMFESGAILSPITKAIKEGQSTASIGAVRTGAGLRGISRAQQIAGQMFNKASIQARAEAARLGTEAGVKEDKIARRKLDLTRVKQAKKEAKSAKLRRAAGVNVFGALADIAGTKTPSVAGDTDGMTRADLKKLWEEQQENENDR